MLKNILEEIPQKILSKYATEKIKTTYKNDLNILKIHEAIIYKFGVFMGRVDDYETENEILEEKLNNEELNLVEINKIKTKIEKNNEFINDYINGISWKKYINKAKPILEKYIPLASDEIKGIININTEIIEDKEIIEKRLVLIELYLNVASKYIEIDATWECDLENNCPNCDKIIEENDENICECGYIYEKNSKICNFVKQNNYNGLSNFIKALDKFEGIYIIQIPEKLYKLLYNYFIKKNMNIEKYYKKLPLNSKGKKMVQI